jgi:hypothetical protein
MYNLFVSEWDDEWKGEPCVLDASRCVRDHEYTDEKIADHYDALDETALKELTRLPSIFAYRQLAGKIRRSASFAKSPFVAAR